MEVLLALWLLLLPVWYEVDTGYPPVADDGGAVHAMDGGGGYPPPDPKP